MKKEIKDFLITYGWAILIIILFIFFIIKNPYYFFPQNKETLVILDKKITTNGTIELIIKNNMEIEKLFQEMHATQYGHLLLGIYLKILM